MKRLIKHRGLLGFYPFLTVKMALPFDIQKIRGWYSFVSPASWQGKKLRPFSPKEKRKKAPL